MRGESGDLGSAGEGGLIRWAVATVSVRGTGWVMHDAACAGYSSLDVGEGKCLFLDARSAWRARLYVSVCATVAVPTQNLCSYGTRVYESENGRQQNGRVRWRRRQSRSTR